MKSNRIILIGLVLVLLFSTMAVYANAEEGENRGSKDGASQGRIDGKSKFKKDSEMDLDGDLKSYLERAWKGDIKKDEDILDPVRDESREFQNGYLAAYRKAYEEAYKAAYTDSEEGENSSSIEGLGASLGMIHGEIAGLKDFESGRDSDWKKTIPNTSEIDRIFDLKKIPNSDRNAFIDQFTENFQTGYEEAYYQGQFGSKRDSMEAGRENGNVFGELLGKTFGIRDYHEGRSLDYNRNMPRESEIRRDYSLNSDNKEYTDGFINGFKNSYQESYANSFREAKNQVIFLEESSSYENGNTVGELQGQIQGNIDQMEKKNNNWKRSKPLSSTIILDHNLMYQTEKYRNGFIAGFWDGYANGYTEVYKDLSLGESISKTTSQTIPIAGEILQSLDGNFMAEVESGIYYKPVIMTIDSLNENRSLEERYISASNFYRLNIVNPSGAYANDKKINIAFEYYGDKDGGIYQLENGKWTYLTSVIEDGAIVAKVNPRTISNNGNVFAVLVDTETEVFHDIRGHWAKDEITAYIRRGVINGYPDKTFRPDKNITRAEFLILLSRIYEWYMPYDTSNNEFFKDYQSFNEYNEKHISYSLSNEYIIGYPDRYFRPYNNISYEEVDIIMKKVLKDPTFKWANYAEQMMYDKKERSSSYDDYDNKITRAEFSYMLYKLNEWKY